MTRHYCDKCGKELEDVRANEGVICRWCRHCLLDEGGRQLTPKDLRYLAGSGAVALIARLPKPKRGLRWVTETPRVSSPLSMERGATASRALNTKRGPA